MTVTEFHITGWCRGAGTMPGDGPADGSPIVIPGPAGISGGRA